MAVEWKELDFFGESKSIPHAKFTSLSTAVLSEFSETYPGVYKADAKFSEKIDLSNFPNYKYYEKRDIVVDPVITMWMGYHQERISFQVVQEYDPKTGSLTLGISATLSEPPSGQTITFELTSIWVYSLYDVSRKEIEPIK